MTVGHLLMFALGVAVGATAMTIRELRRIKADGAFYRRELSRITQAAFDCGKAFGGAIAGLPGDERTRDVDPADRWKLG